MIKQVTTIIGLFFGSLSDFKSGAMKYIWYTGLIAMALLVVIAVFTWKFAGIAGEKVAGLIPWTWAQNSIVFGIMISIGVLAFFWIVLKYVLLFAMGPILSKVSEKAELSLNGKLGSNNHTIIGSASRSVRINVRNLVKELIITILLLIVGFIPGINILAVIALFLIQAYFAGFGIMDFYLERHLGFRQTLSVVYQHKWAAISIGAIFTTLLFVPILGVIVAPYFTTVTATKYFAVMQFDSEKII